MPSITEISFSRLLDDLEPEDGSPHPLHQLQSLKLRYTLVSKMSLNKVISLTPNLQTLDMSFVPTRQIPSFRTPYPPLQKLSLTSTPVTAQDLLKVLPSFAPTLRVLNIGALGASAKNARGHTLGGVGDAGKTLSDNVLRTMTSILMDSPDLEAISLAGNTLLGMSSSKSNSALDFFIRNVGRRLKSLNLGGLTNLRSSDFQGLVYDETMGDVVGGSETKLETLVLVNCTKLDDEAGVYIAGCKNLQVLDLENTKLSSTLVSVDFCSY